jgi:anaerobic selenocysteine-containing dehydrogenase
VLNLMREHYRRYTPGMVARITGIPADQFLEVAKLVGQMGRPDKVMTGEASAGAGPDRATSPGATADTPPEAQGGGTPPGPTGGDE